MPSPDVAAPTIGGARSSASTHGNGGGTDPCPWSAAAADGNGTAPGGGGSQDGHPIHFVLSDGAGEGRGRSDDGHGRIDDGDDGGGEGSRIGTISSARFNILSTMVGGGCLSLPLAFQQSGNALIGPLMLLVAALLTDFCFRLLVASALHLNPPHPTRPGRDTFESVTSAAFGRRAYVFSMTLVVLMCFFGAVGYSVLLRDMMEPVNDAIARHVSASAWLHKNFTMFLVILMVTPFCTLRHLTALKDCGAASMTSVLILGSCIVFRSVQCNVNGSSGGGGGGEPWYTYLTFFPESWGDLLDAVPLYISCFVCHYNILPVHNELEDPTPARVSWWLRSTTWFSLALYMVLGLAGSSYAHCTPTGKVQGNILLDFDEGDPLLMVGRMCLAVTITLAFPMLVIPARDILLRSAILPALGTAAAAAPAVTAGGGGGPDPAEQDGDRTVMESLQEPLLLDEDPPQQEGPQQPDAAPGADAATAGDSIAAVAPASASFGLLLCTSIVIFWTAGAVASCVSSIDVVWDLLGSSLSILLSYLIPAGTYLVITRRSPFQDGYYDDDYDGRRPYGRKELWSRVLCWCLLLFFFPLMVLSTANAAVNTFS